MVEEAGQRIGQALTADTGVGDHDRSRHITGPLLGRTKLLGEALDRFLGSHPALDLRGHCAARRDPD